MSDPNPLRELIGKIHGRSLRQVLRIYPLLTVAGLALVPHTARPQDVSSGPTVLYDLGHNSVLGPGGTEYLANFLDWLGSEGYEVRTVSQPIDPGMLQQGQILVLALPLSDANAVNRSATEEERARR